MKKRTLMTCMIILIGILMQKNDVLAKSPLNQKNTIVIGDSIMLGSGNSNRGYDYYLSEMYGTKTLKNYARGGATVIPSKSFGKRSVSCISSQIDRLISDIKKKNITVDENTIILIDGGVNDVISFRNYEDFKIGKYKDKNKNKACIPTLKSYIDKLRNKAPVTKKCQIVVVVNYVDFSTGHFAPSKNLYKSYKKQLKSYCKSKKYLTYIDVSDQVNKSHTLDGIHLTEKGYKKITKYISKKMK